MHHVALQCQKYGLQNIKKLKFRYFYRIRKEYEYLNKFLYNNYINQAEQNIKCDSQAVWKFINSKRENLGIPNNLTFNGQSSSDLQLICDVFLVFF